MKRRILLLMMTALLSVGAWAENLWNGSETLAYYGFKLTDAVSMSAGDVLTFTVKETTTGWAAIKLKTNDMTPGYATPGTELISTSAAVGTVKIVVTSEVAAAAAANGLWLDGNDCTVTSVDHEKKQATLNLYSSTEGTTVNYWGSGLSKAMFGAVQTGDLLMVTIKSVGADWGANLSVTTLAGGDGNEELATAFISPDALPTTVKIPFTDDMVTAAKSNGLYLNTGTYTYTSVDIVYTPTVTIGSAGYATLGYAAALDLTGIDAYTVTVSGDKAQLTSVKGKKIPANTGIILKGSGDVTIPLTTEATDVITGNDLKVSDGTVTGDGSTIYVLANGTSGVGFYLLKSDDKVPAGKAYLEISGGSGARAFIGFGDDNGTTGIQTIDNGKLTNDNAYYDLQGRRVAQPTKGLYIVNGKKVIIK